MERCRQKDFQNEYCQENVRATCRTFFVMVQNISCSIFKSMFLIPVTANIQIKEDENNETDI
jgi:hypothetical protein